MTDQAADVTTDFNDLTKASVFSLPRFDPQKEMQKLQNLWSKRGTLGAPPPLINRSSLQIKSPSPRVPDKAPQERSFFESDTDTDDEDYSKR